MSRRKRQNKPSDGTDPRLRQAEGRRIRLLYSLGDLQLALSATAFLAECETDERYSKVELRRFRCYEAALVTAYTRPFSQSNGTVPPLNFKMAGLELTDAQMNLHRKLVTMRNKVVAHSDREMMRITTQAFSMPLREKKEIVFVETVFDEGITLLGDLLIETNSLVHLVYSAIYKKLHDEAQTSPELFNLRIDHSADGAG